VATIGGGTGASVVGGSGAATGGGRGASVSGYPEDSNKRRLWCLYRWWLGCLARQLFSCFVHAVGGETVERTQSSAFRSDHERGDSDVVGLDHTAAQSLECSCSTAWGHRRSGEDEGWRGRNVGGGLELQSWHQTRDAVSANKRSAQSRWDPISVRHKSQGTTQHGRVKRRALQAWWFTRRFRALRSRHLARQGSVSTLACVYCLPVLSFLQHENH
jgi:hypothetical protein